MGVSFETLDFISDDSGNIAFTNDYRVNTKKRHHFSVITIRNLYKHVFTPVSMTLKGLESKLFYTKKALGRHQEPINIYKFRTMVQGADKHLNEVLQDLNYQGKIENDPRVTKIGAFLRKYRIDEVPQLINLLRGDIKLVGVRPMEEDFWKRYPIDIKETALKYKPGWNGVNYISTKKEGIEHFEILRTYLKEYEQNPIRTDIKYFFKIWYNIIGRLEKSV